MLHTESITSGTLETLKQLMRDETLQDFFLVGGTALALYMWVIAKASTSTSLPSTPLTPQGCAPT